MALSLAKATKKNGDIISYRGEGVFLTVKHGRNATADAPEEETFNKFLLTLQSQRQSKVEAQVIVGDSVSLRSLSKSGSLMSISRAIENVELRDQMAQVEPAQRRAAAASGETDKKRAYETVLRDLFREDPSLRND